ncbi:uncharacterized protein LOC144652658 [Oculina patagonica]
MMITKRYLLCFLINHSFQTFQQQRKVQGGSHHVQVTIQILNKAGLQTFQQQKGIQEEICYVQVTNQILNKAGLQNPLTLRNAKGSYRIFTIPQVRLKSSHGTQSLPFILLRYTHSYLGLKMTERLVE